MKVKGDGYIEQLEKDVRRSRCRKWRLWVRVGYNPIKRKYDRRSKVFNGSYSEAMRALEGFKCELRSSSYGGDGAITWKQASETWVDEQLLFGEIVESTAEKKLNFLNAVGYHINDIPIAKIDENVLEEVYAKLLSGDSASGKPIASSTISCYARTANALMKYAAKKGWTDRMENPRTFSEESPERRALTTDESLSLLSKLDVGNHRHIAIMLYLLAGLRRAEALTLRWEDFDEAMGTLHVHGTKTEAADAVVALLPELQERLFQWKQIQALRLEIAGLRQVPKTLIVSEYGEPISPQVISKWWRRNRAQLGCEGIGLHELRHTFATMLARADVPTVKAATLLRDKDVRVVEKVYTHIKLNEQRDAIARLRSSFN